MRRSMSRLFAVMIGSVLVGTAVADGPFRCGSKIIVVGMSQAEVLEQCGEPATRTVEVQDVRSGTRVVGKTEVNRWTYESYSATRVLVFDQDRLKSIE